MRALPGMCVAAPGDPAEVGAVLDDLITSGGPAYLRLGKTGEPAVHSGAVHLPRGTSIALTDAGGDVLLCSTGAVLADTVRAAELLAGDGITAGVRSFPWLDPFDTAAIRAAAGRYAAIVTVEEHSIVGGLGSAVAETLAEEAAAVPLIRVALPHQASSIVGDQEFLRGAYGLDPESIRHRVLTHFESVTQREAHRGLASQVR
jgi:transketolase